MKSLLLLSFLLSCSHMQAQEANYFRVWQGFQKPTLSKADFLQTLPSFMKATVDLYHYQNNSLVNYIVVIPPKNKPSFIPDELALVALSSKNDYQFIRQTSEGQKYSESHWSLFNKENSKSSEPIISTLPSNTFVHNQSYDMIGNPINWSRGYTMVYIGLRKSTITQSDFLENLTEHATLFKQIMQPKGVLGYILIANNDYEIAYVNWSSKAAHDNAFKNTEGAKIAENGSQILDNLYYQNIRPIDVYQDLNVNEGESFSMLPSSTKN